MLSFFLFLQALIPPLKLLSCVIVLIFLLKVIVQMYTMMTRLLTAISKKNMSQLSSTSSVSSSLSDSTKGFSFQSLCKTCGNKIIHINYFRICLECDLFYLVYVDSYLSMIVLEMLIFPSVYKLVSMSARRPVLIY